MTPAEMPEDAETYLRQFERDLIRLPSAERGKIVQEIASHLAEREAVGPQMLHAAITQLGPPSALARSFLDDWLLAGALDRGSALRILVVILMRAWRSFAAIAIGTAGVLLYAFALAFLVVAILKPITPRSVGLWRDGHGGFSDFGVVYGAVHTTPEVLGWSVIPISLAVAVIFWLAAGWVMRNGGRLLLRR
jgi:hypothetical protein